MKNINGFISGFVLLALIMVNILPTVALAQSTAISYQPQTEGERMAYLYGRISLLLELKAALEKQPDVSLMDTAVFDFITIETRRASDVGETTAVLRGEVFVYGKATASVWFEYGEDEDFLDFRTSRRTVRSEYDRAMRVSVSRLEDDEKYYFRIAALDKSGDVHYGPIFSFRTD